jgi:putative endonuclease
MKQPCVYILASKRNGTLYVGVTPDLVQRVWQHRNEQVDGFTKRYGVHRLVWKPVVIWQPR